MDTTRTMTPLAWRAFAWTGGGMFVVSLAGGAWFVAMTLGRSSSGGWRSAVAPALADALWFSLFALHHSVMARPAAKQAIARYVPAALERALYVWTASALFLVLCLAWTPVPGTLWRLDGLWRWVAYGMQAGAFAFVVAGARALDPLELAGIRAVERPAASRRTDTGTAFRARGAYAVVRHPIYSGTIVLLACMPEMTSGRFLFTALTTVYIVMAIPWEERGLVAQHAAAYRDYQRTVRWRLVPGVY